MTDQTTLNSSSAAGHLVLSIADILANDAIPADVEKHLPGRHDQADHTAKNRSHLTSAHQREARAKLPKEVEVRGGKASFNQLVQTKFGGDREAAIDNYLERGAAYRRSHPSELVKTVSGWLDKIGVAYQTDTKIGPRLYVDFLVGNRKAVEVDGEAWHAKETFFGQDRQARDAKKDAKLHSLGFEVLRLTEADISSGVAEKNIIDYIQDSVEKHLVGQHDQHTHSHLYHGTRSELFGRILKYGLRPNGTVKTTTGQSAKVYLGIDDFVPKMVATVSSIMHSRTPDVYVFEVAVDDEKLGENFEHDPDEPEAFVSGTTGISKRDFISATKYNIKKEVWVKARQYLRSHPEMDQRSLVRYLEENVPNDKDGLPDLFEGGFIAGGIVVPLKKSKTTRYFGVTSEEYLDIVGTSQEEKHLPGEHNQLEHGRKKREILAQRKPVRNAVGNKLNINGKEYLLFRSDVAKADIAKVEKQLRASFRVPIDIKKLLTADGKQYYVFFNADDDNVAPEPEKVPAKHVEEGTRPRKKDKLRSLLGLKKPLASYSSRVDKVIAAGATRLESTLEKGFTSPLPSAVTDRLEEAGISYKPTKDAFGYSIVNVEVTADNIKQIAKAIGTNGTLYLLDGLINASLPKFNREKPLGKLDNVLFNFPDGKDEIRRAETFISKHTAKTRVPALRIDGYNDGRAYYEPRYGGEIHTGDESFGLSETIVHEFGHHFEHSHRLVGVSRDFLLARGGQRVKLSSIKGKSGDANEEVYQDKFVDAYAGKIYPDATEILSVGFEQMSKMGLRRPMFLKKDPDHFLYTLGAMSGDVLNG